LAISVATTRMITSSFSQSLKAFTDRILCCSLSHRL
jgi:hypothetical protein